MHFSSIWPHAGILVHSLMWLLRAERQSMNTNLRVNFMTHAQVNKQVQGDGAKVNNCNRHTHSIFHSYYGLKPHKQATEEGRILCEDLINSTTILKLD